MKLAPIGLGILVLCPVLLSGCRNPAATTSSDGQNPAVAKAAPTPDPFVKLTPYESGPGIFVSDPGNGNAGARAFGAACTRWLFYTLGSQVELGRTPPWREIVNFGVRHRPGNLELEDSQFELVGRELGVTHVIASQFDGDFGDADKTGFIKPGEAQQSCTLTLQLKQVADGADVGSPVKITGTPQTILSQLPAAALQLGQRLGVSQLKVPETVPESPLQMMEAGLVPLDPEERISLRGMRALYLPTTAAPFLVFLANRSWGLGPLNVDALNLMAWGNQSIHDPTRFQGHASEIAALANKFPHNYQVTLAQARLTELQNNPGEWLRLLEESTRCAPKDPYAWYRLSEALATHADNIREGRASTAVSSTEWGKLDRLYPLSEAAANRTVQLSPQTSHFWFQLASTATFNGDNDVAVDAIWKAQKLDPSSAEVYRWGLEMFQPKWLNRPDDLLEMASQVLARDELKYFFIGRVLAVLSISDWRQGKGREITDALFHASFADKNGWFWNTDASVLRKWDQLWTTARNNPDDPKNWKALDDALAAEIRKTRMARPYSALSRSEANFLSLLYGYQLLCATERASLDAKDPEIWHEIYKAAENMPIFTGWQQKAVSEALRLTPKDPEVVAWLLTTYSATSKERPALKALAARAIRDSQFKEREAMVVVNTFRRLPQMDKEEKAIYALAQAELAQQVQRKDNPKLQERLMLHFWTRNDIPHALNAAANWVQAAPQSAEAHYQHGQLLVAAKGKSSAESNAEFRAALAQDPNMPQANYEVGRILIGEKKLPEAEAAFRKAISVTPYWPEPWTQLGLCLLMQKRRDEAMKAFSKSADLGEDNYNQVPAVRMARDYLWSMQ